MESKRDNGITVERKRIQQRGNIKRASSVSVETNTISKHDKVDSKKDSVSIRNNDRNIISLSVPHREERKGNEETAPKSQWAKSSVAATQKQVHRQSAVFVEKGSEKKGNHSKKFNAKPLTKVANKAKNVLDNEGNSDAKALSMGITTTQVAIKSFKAAQKVTPTLLKASKGTYHVAMGTVTKTVKVVKSVDSTIAMLKTGAIVLDKDTGKRLISFAKNKLISTRPALAVTRAINKIKNIKINSHTVAKSAKYVINGGFKNSVFVGKKIGKGIDRGISSVGTSMMNADDMGIQTIGIGLKIAQYTVKSVALSTKTAKYTLKGVKTGVKGVYNTGAYIRTGGIKTYKGVKTGIQTAKKVGVSKTAKIYADKWSKSTASKASIAVKKAGESIVTAAIDLIRSLGSKFLIPLLLILVILMFGSSMLSAAGGALGAILSPFLSDDSGNTIDEISFMSTEITAKRNELIQDVKDTYRDNLVVNGGNYHYVRYFNAFNDTEIEFTDTNINTSIYSVQEYIEAIQPVFHTVILSEYDMSASLTQMKNVLKNMWNSLNTITTVELPTEYCNMSVAADGTVSPITDTDGVVHANIVSCPNHSGLQTHIDDINVVLASCDYWYYICNGHKGNLNCGFEFHYHGDGFCNYCKDGLEEHTHSSSCCSKPSHVQCSFATCGLYIGAVCNDYHDHSVGGCNTSNCGNKPAHTHGRNCCTRTPHSHSDWHSPTDSGCHETIMHSGNLTADCGNSTKHKGCNGYYVCNGHRILSLSISLNSFGDLLAEYYLDEIADLQAIATRTTDQEKRLNELESSYEICLTYLNILEEEYGYGTGTGIVGLDGVTLTALTDFACGFVGNPYVWGGTNPNTGADCSGFVQYVFAHFGVSLPRVSSDQVHSGVTVPNIASAQAGDLLFWSDTGTDSGVYHVAIYLGEGKIVHASNSRPYPSGGIKISNVYGTIHKIKRIY